MKNNQTPRLVLWDWNGTLLDDLDFSIDCLNALLAEHSYDKTYQKDAYQAIFGFPIEEYYVRAGFDFTKHPFSELAKRYVDIFMPGSINCHVAKGGRDTLNAIHTAGVTQVVLSASPTEYLKSQVAERKLTPYFDELLGLDDIYAKSKTARGIAWMQASGIDPATAVMIGDTDHDAQVAAAMGVRCILCTNGHQNRETLAATGATLIDSLTELPPLLGL